MECIACAGLPTVARRTGLPLAPFGFNIVPVIHPLWSPKSMPNFIRRPIIREIACLVVGALAAASCGRDATGLHNAGFGSIVLKPLFQTTSGGDKGFDQPVNLRIVVALINPQAASPSTRVKEISTSVVPFSSVNGQGENTDSVVVKATFPIQADGSTYQVVVKGINSAGDTTYSIGPSQFTSSQIAGGAVTVTGQAVYVGPGSNATRVAISPRGITVATNSSGGTFTAQAFLGTVALPQALFDWISLNSTVADVGNHTDNSVTVFGHTRGTAKIVVRVAGSGVSDTVTVVVVPVIQTINVVSGNGQSATVGSALANPIVVRAGANDGSPLAGATVTFTAQNGGSANPATAITAADGTAQTVWTLGSNSGSQRMGIAAVFNGVTQNTFLDAQATFSTVGIGQYNGNYSGNWSGGQSNGSNLTGTISFAVGNGAFSGTTSAISGSTNTVTGSVSGTGAVSGSIPANTNGCNITFSGQISTLTTGVTRASGTYALVTSSTCNAASGTWSANRVP